MSKLPWDERVTMLQINPDAASRDDVARLAEQVAAYEAALREIAARPCCGGPDIVEPCYRFFGVENRDNWCPYCIAFNALEGGAT